MDEEVFNMSIRKFLKKVGVTSQREIEQAIRKALEDGAITDDVECPVKMTLELSGVAPPVEISGSIKMSE